MQLIKINKLKIKCFLIFLKTKNIQKFQTLYSQQNKSLWKNFSKNIIKNLKFLNKWFIWLILWILIIVFKISLMQKILITIHCKIFSILKEIVKMIQKVYFFNQY